MDVQVTGGRVRGRYRTWAAVCVLTLTSLAMRPAHAQWAVVDVGAITQLVQALAVLEQQLQTARSALTQAQSQYSALTGQRGMAQLLSGQNRNYLPQSFAQVEQVLTGASGEYSALSQAVQTLVTANAVLSATQLSTLSPADRTLVIQARENAAFLSATSQSALSTASSRFATLQQLITAMASAQDPKGDLDLQARIEAEQTMLTNEQIKLGALGQVIDGQQALQAEQRREQAVADVGSLRTLAPLNLP
jgi:type IV secretion system protein VirB5